MSDGPKVIVYGRAGAADIETHILRPGDLIEVDADGLDHVEIDYPELDREEDDGDD